MLFLYKIAYKVATWYTPYQLVYELHPLMPIEYIVLVVGGNEKDNTSVRVLTNRITELEKLRETKMQAVKTTSFQQWNRTLWSQQKNLEKQFNFGDYVCGFQRAINHTSGSLLGNGSHRTKYNMCC